MQNRYGYSQFNNSFVNPVFNLRLGLFADGKILHCENLDFR